MAKIKIEYIKHNLAKNGKTKLCSIKTIDNNGNEVWIGGFGNNTTESWQKGQTIDLDIFQEEYNGTLKWKFREPAERNVLTEIDKLNAKIDLLVSQMSQMVNSATQAPKTSQNANLTQGMAQEITVEDCERAFGGEIVGEYTEYQIPF